MSEVEQQTLFVDTESALFHTPTLQEVVEMLYPDYKGCQALYQTSEVEVHAAWGQISLVYARKAYCFVVMEAPGGFRFLLEVHENCFRADGPQPYPEHTVSAAEAEREVFGESYTVLPSGRATVCQLTTATGHTFEGIGYTIDGENFNLKQMREKSRRRAMEKVYEHLAAKKREFIGRKHAQD